MGDSSTLSVFRALGDEGRLRILRAVDAAELSVAELVQVLSLPQSTVSRHLKPLRESGLLGTRREGTSVYYRRGPVFQDELFARLLRVKLAEMRGADRDRAAVERALEMRRKESLQFFDQIAGQYGTLTQPGGGWQALAAALAAGFAGRTVADIGCGEGDVTLMLARFARRVNAIDLSSRMLRIVEERSVEAGVSRRVHTSKGDLEKLPLEDASQDAVFLSQVLHHAARPAEAVQEAARVLKPGGYLIILDLARHDQAWTREQWADQWLGFEEESLCEWVRDAGCVRKVCNTLEGPEPAFAIQLAVAEKQKETKTKRKTS